MKKLLSWILIASSLALTACGQAPAPASQAPAPKPEQGEAAQQATPIRLVYDNVSISTALLWVMDEKGIFEKYGLAPTLEVADGPAATQALVAGQYDFGFISPSSLVAANVEQLIQKIVASTRSKQVYSLVADQRYSRIDQLRGGTFGIARIGDQSDTATRAIVRQLGLDPEKDISIQQVGNSPVRYAALVSGNIDAMLADPMDVIRARRDGFNILATPATLNIPQTGGTFAVRNAYLEEHPEVVRRLVMAVADGVHYYKTHPGEVAAISAPRLRVDDMPMIRAGVESTANEIMSRSLVVQLAGLQPIIDEEARRNPALRGMPFERFVDNSFAEELDKTGFIDQLYR